MAVALGPTSPPLGTGWVTHSPLFSAPSCGLAFVPLLGYRGRSTCQRRLGARQLSEQRPRGLQSLCRMRPWQGAVRAFERSCLPGGGSEDSDPVHLGGFRAPSEEMRSMQGAGEGGVRRQEQGVGTGQWDVGMCGQGLEWH